MKSGNINFIDTELTNEQFTSLGYPALYILKNSSNIITKFIIFDLNGVRTDYNTSSGGGTGVTEEWVNSQISTAIVGLQDNRLEFNEFSDFPEIGDETKFYIDLTDDRIYIWDTTSSTYKNQSWNTATIASIQASIASAQMAFQNLENSKQNKLETVSGSTGVGKTDASATEKLDVNGNVKATGFKTPGGTVTQSLTANGGVFDLNLKVDKVTGKQLSTEDYTTTEKSKLAGIQPGAKVNVNADWDATTGDAQILNKPSTFPPSTHTHVVGDVTGLQSALDGKQNNLNYTPENITNKSDSYTASSSTTYASSKALVDGLTTKLDKGTYTGTAQDLKNDIDNIQIGGRNLLLKSNNSVNINNMSPDFNQHWIGLSELAKIDNIQKITYYTLTLYYESLGNNYVEDFKSVVLGKISDISDAWSLRFYYENAKIEPISNGVLKAVITIKAEIGSYIGNNQFGVGVIIESNNNGILLHRAKLEEGNKATDWTPAPEDKQDRLQDVTGYIGVGKTDASATEKLDVNGNIKATGYKTPTGTANKALTSDGGTFDLHTKADLEGGKVPASQLPSYVDDVLEFANLASFPATGESGKIYIAIDTNITYRWGGSSYVGISSSLALGETASTAYRGDRGKTAYDHSQVTHDKTLVGLGNVDNTSDLDKPVSTATQNALNSKVDKVAGKQLSTEDYTTTEKNKLAGIQSGAEINVNADWNATTGDAQILNKPSTFPPSTHTHVVNDITGLQTALDGKQNVLTSPVTGTGVTNLIPKFLSGGTIGNSSILDDGTKVGIGKIPSSEKLEVDGNIKANGFKTPSGTPTQALTADGNVFDLTKKINIGSDTVSNFKNISAMTLTEFRNITPNTETIYFTEEQNSTGWQQMRLDPFTSIVFGGGLIEQKVNLYNETSVELDSDSTFSLIDVENTKINGINVNDFVIINFSGNVLTPLTANQWFKIILRINGVQAAVSPVFYLLEPSETYEQIAHNFALNVTPEMVTYGATLHIKCSTNLVFRRPAITVVRVHKSTNANL